MRKVRKEEKMRERSIRSKEKKLYTSHRRLEPKEEKEEKLDEKEEQNEGMGKGERRGKERGIERKEKN